jgi:hypothetical protein
VEKKCDLEGRDLATRDFLDSIFKKLSEYFINCNPTNANLHQIDEHISLLISHQNQFRSGTSDTEQFLTIGQIENMMVQLKRHLGEVDLQALLADMEQLNAEEELILKKKDEFRNKMIKLRKNRRYWTSVMTLAGRVQFQRMALLPSMPLDVAKAKELGVSGLIFPVDEALGLNRLPFKITVGAMLEIAKESSRRESYEDAEKTLKEKTSIIINDDTMRLVTNAIGGLVYNNDVKTADELWAQFKNGGLNFPDKKKDYTLYLEVDGAMFPTRQEGKKGTIYKENKLGMAFSTDNLFWWTDKHGYRQHRITKREYTALIGDSDDFTKLMFSLASKNGYGKYKTTVLLSDGATWIRNMKNYIFPDAQQILNFYHLKEHIADFAKIIYNQDESKYKPFAEEVSELFKNSCFKEAINLIKCKTSKKFKIDLNKLHNYLNNNIENIDYKSYRSLGYFIGSGAIESSNKTVLQRRLKYGAMRWNVESGQAVVTLVAKARSGLWDTDVVQAAFSHYNEPLPASYHL